WWSPGPGRGRAPSPRSQCPFDGSKLGLDADRGRGVADGQVGILQTVAGQGAHDALSLRESSFRMPCEQPGDTGSRGGLTEDTLLLGEPGPGLQNRRIAHRADVTLRSIPGLDGPIPAGRIADADRRGDRLRRLDRGTAHQGTGALGLIAHHPGPLLDLTEIGRAHV